MCGRYGLRSDKQDIATAFYAKKVNPKVVLAPDYNVAPSTFLPVIRLDEEGDRELTLMRWGLIPFFSKDDKTGFKSTSARAETIATVPTFREAFKRAACTMRWHLGKEFTLVNRYVGCPFLRQAQDSLQSTHPEISAHAGRMIPPTIISGDRAQRRKRQFYGDFCESQPQLIATPRPHKVNGGRTVIRTAVTLLEKKIDIGEGRRVTSSY